MVKQMSMQRLGQNMPFHAPQMGPSMSPAFVFGVGDQTAPTTPTIPTTPVTPFPAAPTPPPEPAPMQQEVAVTPAPASKAWVGPVAVVAVVAILVGLTA